MSTNSSIWIKNADGTFEGVYCHWDGYVDGVGATLAQHYADERKVRDLISLGSISSLKKYTGVNNLPETHSFDTPADDITIVYCRDRGEDLNINKVETQEDTITEEYNYIFDNGTWYVEFEEIGKYEPVGSHLSVD